MAKCTVCGKFLPTTGVAACTLCHCKYHKGCVAVPDGTAVAKDWVCPDCISKKKGADSGSTPGRGAGGSPAAAPVPAGGPAPPSSGGSEVAALRREMAEYIAEQREFRAEIRASLRSMVERMDEIERRLDAVESREAEVPPRGGDVGQLQRTVERLQLELNDRDQDALLADLDIGQLPEEPGENVVHTVTVLAAKLGVALEPRDVVFAERVGAPAAAGRARRVVVRLTRRQLRDDLLRAARVRRNLSSADAGQAGPPRRVYVNERLTRVNRQLFSRVREECHRCRWRFSWTRRGRIYARQGEGKQAFCLRSDADTFVLSEVKWRAKACHTTAYASTQNCCFSWQFQVCSHEMLEQHSAPDQRPRVFCPICIGADVVDVLLFHFFHCSLTFS